MKKKLLTLTLATAMCGGVALAQTASPAPRAVAPPLTQTAPPVTQMPAPLPNQVVPPLTTMPGGVQPNQNAVNPFVPNHGMALTAADNRLLFRIDRTFFRNGLVLNQLPLSISVQNGFVTVFGTVPNVQTQQAVDNLVASVPGIVGFNDRMLVASPPRF